MTEPLGYGPLGSEPLGGGSPFVPSSPISEVEGGGSWVYDPTQSTDHIARGLERFIEQFRNKPVLAAVLTSYLRQVQELEDAIWEVITKRTIANGTGVLLDKIGKIVGRGRGNLSDPDYRIALRAQIRINRSCGTPKDIFEVAKLSLDPVYSLPYFESYPAAIVCDVPQQAEFVISVLFANLVLTKSGGVRLQLTYTPDPLSDVFTFSADTDSHTDARRGWNGGTLRYVLDSATL